MNKAALLISVTGNPPHLANLTTPEKNIAAVKEILLDTEKGGFEKNEFTYLCNPNADEMNEAIINLCQQRCELIFLYFSGHGTDSSYSNQLYLTTSETRRIDNQIVVSTVLSIDEVTNLFNNAHAEKQVIVLDCCFSGDMGERLANFDKMKRPSRAIFTSAMASQRSFELDSSFSCFSRCFVEGLNGLATTNDKGQITVDTLSDYINQRFPELYPNTHQPQLFVQTKTERDIVLALTKRDISVEQQYREKVLEIAEANNGDIPATARYWLEQWREQKGLTAEQTAEIETAILEPIRNYHTRLKQFEQALRQAVEEAECDAKKSLSLEVSQLRKIAILKPVDMVKVICQVAKDLQKRSCFQIAISLLGTALDLDKSYPLVYLGWGDCLLNQGKLSEALEKYDQALNLDPYLAEAHWGKGEVLARQNHHQEATIRFREALNLNRQLVKAYRSLAGVLEAQGYPQAGITELKKALEINPDDPLTLYALSRLLEEQGKIQESNQSLQKAKLLLENIAPNSEDADLWTNWGNLLITLRQLSESKPKLEQALRLNPRHPEAQAGMGSYYYYQGDMDSAIVYYEEALRLNPSLAFLYNNLGYVYLVRQNYTKAIAQFEKGLEITPDYAILYLGLAEVYKAQGNYHQAIKSYETAIRLNPGLSSAYMGLADVRSRLGQDTQAEYERVINHYQEVIKINPNNGEAYQVLGQVFVDQGKFKEAINYYEKSIELLPDQSYPYINLGFTLLQTANKIDRNEDEFKEKIGQAQELFNKALAINEREPNAYLGLADVWRFQQKYDKAVIAINQALLLQPTFADAYHLKGHLFLEQNKIDDAIKSYNKALELNPNAPWIYHNLGEAYYQLKNWEKAEEYLRQAIELNPNQASFHNSLGNCYANRQQTIEAITCYQKAIELSPEEAVFYNNLGRQLQEKGDLEAAVSAFRNAVILEPNSAIDYNDLGLALWSVNNWDEAIVAFKKSTENNSQNAVFYINLGNALQQRNQEGDLSQAIQAYDQAVLIDDEDVDTHFVLGKALSQYGNLEKSMECLQKAKGLAKAQNLKIKVGEIEAEIIEVLIQKAASSMSEKASETANSIAKKASNLWRHLF